MGEPEFESGFFEMLARRHTGLDHSPDRRAGTHLFELELCSLFRKLDLQVFHLTGKSDRPDAVIDISLMRSHPDDLLSYLRDSTKCKLLMETTLGEYTGGKLVQDTIAKNTRGLTKFETHTQHVLKIKAEGQIIVANYFSKNISTVFEKVKRCSHHIITLIDKDTVKYLIEKYHDTQDVSIIVKILTSGKVLDKNIIDLFFKN